MCIMYQNEASKNRCEEGSGFVGHGTVGEWGGGGGEQCFHKHPNTLVGWDKLYNMNDYII